jgi:hypothetical protein
MKLRPLTLGLAIAIAALLHGPSESELALATTSNAEWTKLREVQVVPAFVSPGRLNQFLLAVDEATDARQAAREAAEALSAKFADETSKATEEAPKTIHTKQPGPDASEDVRPWLWPAALSVSAVPLEAATAPKPYVMVNAHAVPTKPPKLKGARLTSFAKKARSTVQRYQDEQQTTFGQTGPGAKRVGLGHLIPQDRIERAV